MTTILSVDPGICNCAYTLLENRVPIASYSWINFTGDVIERSLSICKTLQLIAERHQPDMFVCEEYFSPRKFGRPSTNYSRGILDGLIRVAMGHLPQCWLNPKWLKKWTTHSANATKPQMMEALEKLADEHMPDVHKFWRTEYTTAEHLLESWMLGCVGHWLWNRQWQGSAISNDKRELLNRIENKEPVSKPMFAELHALPICLEYAWRSTS